MREILQSNCPFDVKLIGIMDKEIQNLKRFAICKKSFKIQKCFGNLQTRAQPQDEQSLKIKA